MTESYSSNPNGIKLHSIHRYSTIVQKNNEQNKLRYEVEIKFHKIANRANESNAVFICNFNFFCFLI